MAECITLALFCAVLVACVVFDGPLVAALAVGLAIFIGYGLLTKHKLPALIRMCLQGVKTAGKILTTFVLIGMLTALWRASGCVSAIVCYASGLIRPQIFPLAAFLLCSLVSVLTGTAFGTAATMGVICAGIARGMGVPVFWTGGAILAGCFFGDRCSPVSTSALLTATLTKTDIYANIRGMVKTGLVPAVAACAVYLAAGLLSSVSGAPADVYALFGREFVISWVCLLPAAAIVIPACFRMGTKPMMAISIAVCVPVALLVQHIPAGELLRAAVHGFKAKDASLSAMTDGGGIASMVRVAAIVSIASCYSGLFRGTALEGAMRRMADSLPRRWTPFFKTMVVAVPVAAISCNQTLGIMLTEQLTSHLEPDAGKRAVILEDTAVVISPVIPWSIACSVPLTTVGASAACAPAAVFLWMLPLWGSIASHMKGRGAG